MSQETEIGKLLVRLVGDGTSHSKMLAQARADMAQTSKVVEKSNQDMVVFGKTIDSLGTKMSSMAGQFRAMAAIESPFEFLKKSVGLAGQTERTQTDFGVLLQSVEKGNKLTADLQKFAAATPLSMAGLQSASKTLLQFDIAAEDLLPTLKMLGDSVGGDEQKLQSMARAFGQMSSTGRLMGGDLMQMINVGFNPLQEISKKTGKSIGELRKEMERGAGPTVEQVAEAFKTATAEGGRFNNGMEMASKTFEGLVSTMHDDIDQFKGEIGKSVIENLKLKDAIKLVSEAAQYLKKQFIELDPALKTVTAGVVALTLAFGALIITWKVGAIAVGMVIGVMRDVIISIRAATAATWAHIVAMRAGVVTTYTMVGATVQMEQANVAAARSAYALKAALVVLVAAGVIYLVRELQGGRRALNEFNEAMKESDKLSERLSTAVAKTSSSHLGRISGMDEGERLKAYQAELDQANKDLETTNKVKAKAEEDLKKLRAPTVDPDDSFISERGAGWVADRYRRNMPGVSEDFDVNEEMLKKDITEAESRADGMRARIAAATKAMEEFKKAQAAAYSEKLIATATDVATAIAAGFEKAAKAAEKLDSSCKSLTKSLEESLATWGMSSREASIYKLEVEGASKAQLAAANDANAVLDLLEAQQRMFDAGATMNEEFMDPQEKFNEKMAELNELLSLGAITQQTFNKAQVKAKDDLADATKGVEELRHEVQKLDATLSGGAEAKARISAFATMMGADVPANRTNAQPTSGSAPMMQSNKTLTDVLTVLLQMRDLAAVEAAKQSLDVQLTDLSPWG